MAECGLVQSLLIKQRTSGGMWVTVPSELVLMREVAILRARPKSARPRPPLQCHMQLDTPEARDCIKQGTFWHSWNFHVSLIERQLKGMAYEPHRRPWRRSRARRSRGFAAARLLRTPTGTRHQRCCTLTLVCRDAWTRQSAWFCQGSSLCSPGCEGLCRPAVAQLLGAS